MGAASAKARKKRTGRPRQVRRTYFDNVVGTGDLAGLSAALDEAKRLVAATRIMSGDADARDERIKLAEAEVERLRKEIAKHRDRIWFEPISAPKLEALRLAHPDESEVKDGELWSFIPAVVAACAVDSDDTEEEWAAEIASYSLADRRAIWQAAWACNTEPASTNLGKD